MANGIGGPGVGMGGPSGPGGPAYQERRGMNQQQRQVPYARQLPWRGRGETPEQRRKRLDKERKEKQQAERRRGRSLLTGYAPPTLKRATLLMGQNDSPQIY